MKLYLKHKLPVYKKVIIVFIGLIIPIYLIIFCMSRTGISYIKKEYTKSINENSIFYARQLDGQIAFIRNLQLQFLYDSDLGKLGFLGGQLDSFEKFKLVSSVKERLFNIYNSSNYIMNVGVYVKSYGMVISTLNGVNNVPNEDYEIIKAFQEMKPRPYTFFINGRVFFIETANNDSLICFLELSTEELKKTLAQLEGVGTDSGAMLVDDNYSGEIIHNSKGESIDKSTNNNIRDVNNLPSIVDGEHYKIQANKEIKSSLGMSDNSKEHEFLKCIINNVPKKDKSEISYNYIVKSRNKSVRVNYNRISSLGLSLYSYINENEITKPLRKFNIWFIVLGFASIPIIILFSFSVNHMIHKPLRKLIDAFKMVDMDNLEVSIGTAGDVEFNYLYESFDRMAGKLKKSIVENYEQKIALQHSELKQLQSQINPHFLYNGFYNIYMMCKAKDYETVSILARRLGSYYQFITRNGSDEVSFATEYKHAMDYVEIQCIRFSNRIEVEANGIPESCKNLSVPRLILQPVIENTFEHAFEHERRGGTLYIFVTHEENILKICVEDDGSKLTEDNLNQIIYKLNNSDKVDEKTGIVNVCRRIRLKYGKSSGLIASRSKYGGLKIEIIIINQGGCSDV